MTILVAVSRAHTRDSVLDVAVRFARAFDSELYIVHLVTEEGPPRDASQIREELRERVLDEGIVATVAVESVDATLARTGPQLGRELLDIATDVDVTHIVVGHTSRGLVDGLARGTTAFTVADGAPVPVTIVPERTDAE